VGLFDNLFRKDSKSADTPQPPANTPPLEKTAEMLDEDKYKYWAIVDASRKATRDQDAQKRYLVSQIANLSPKEIIGFRLRTDCLLYHTTTHRYGARAI